LPLKSRFSFFLSAEFLLCLALLVNVVIYYQGVNGPYILDDYPNLIDNPKILIHDLDYDSLKSAALSSNSSRFYRPLSMLTFAADYYVAGNKNPYSVKLTNIFIHCIIAIGIYLLTLLVLTESKYTAAKPGRSGNKWVALLTASIWLFHPLFVSTVLYAIQRMAMLSCLFVVYGCIAYCCLRNRIVNQKRGYWLLLLTITSFTLLGFLAKENGFLLTGFILLIEHYLFDDAIYKNRPAYFSVALKTVLFTPVIIIISYLVYSYIHNYAADLPNFLFDINERVLTEFRILWHYLGWLTFLNPEQYGIYHDDIAVSTGLLTPATTLISIIAWIFVVIAALRLKRLSPIIPFSLFWFLWGQSLESTTIPLSIIFEHRNYLPGYGPILALSYFVYTLAVSRKTSKLFSVAIISIFIGLPVALLINRVDNWHDSRSLAVSQIKLHPQSGYALAYAASYLQISGDIKNSLAAINRARDLYPRNNYFLFSKILVLCQSRPDRRFDAPLIRSIQSVSDTRAIPATVTPYRRIVTTCTDSEINRNSLLILYKKFRSSSNTAIAALSYYGLGKIYLSRKEYKKAVTAWQKSAKIHPMAASLIPEIKKVQNMEVQ